MKIAGVTLAIALTALFSVWAYRHFHAPSEQALPPALSQASSYWTCPMHPQVHSEKPGECPICHMRLVEAKTSAQPVAAEESEQRAPVSASPYQLKLMGLQKVRSERMDLDVVIPISGRLISPSRIAFQVYESDLAYIRPGLKFTAFSSLRPETEISGEIVSVDSIADPTSRTVRVVGAVKQGPSGLIAETTFSGKVKIPLKGVVAVPESAVLHAGDRDLVYVVEENGILRAQPVQLGEKAESYYEVLSGLEAGRWISSGPNFLLDSEAKIRAAGQAGHEAQCPTGQHWDQGMAMCMPGK